MHGIEVIQPYLGKKIHKPTTTTCIYLGKYVIATRDRHRRSAIDILMCLQVIQKDNLK